MFKMHGEVIMKNILFSGLVLISLSAFSQSYLVLSNGVTLTTDTAGFVYDFGHFAAPYTVSVKGGQFLVENEKLSTIDSKGFLYNKDLKIKKNKIHGTNYILNSDGSLVTIDQNGFYYLFDEDKVTFKNPLLAGGNYFTVKTGKKKDPVHFYSVNSVGNYFKLDVVGLNPLEIGTVGGNYFQTKDGTFYTVSKEGFVYSKTEFKIGSVKSTGGNFFIDDTNKLYTISADGLLILPVLPANLAVTNLLKFGANYMIDSEGRMFTVDSLGVISERVVKNHDLRNTKILSF